MRGVEIIKALGSDVEKMLKDIPVDHLVHGVQLYNRALFIKYFKGYRPQVAGRKRILELVNREIREKENEELAQLLVTLWNRANGRLYHAMYNKVRSINEEVDRIERIDDERAMRFMDELLEEYNSDRIYLCILLNEVKFSREAIKRKLGKEIPLKVWPPPPERAEEKEAPQGEEEESKPGEETGTPGSSTGEQE